MKLMITLWVILTYALLNSLIRYKPGKARCLENMEPWEIGDWMIIAAFVGGSLVSMWMCRSPKREQPRGPSGVV